jgi:L-aspartate oxidase
VVDRAALQAAMSAHASVVRDATGLNRLADTLHFARAVSPRNRTGFEDAALTTAARAVTAAAAARTESRGCHHRGDFPDTDPTQEVSMTVRIHDGDVAVEIPTAVCS